ncbi:MAG: purine-nucleoside phosphorylase, partial [Rubrivivax sp.]|nr:purine-nucleoside phosphorylase [Rubrivivax sp.]
MNADLITASATTLRQRLGHRAPKVAVLLGSGWGPFAQQVRDAVQVPYADLPAFPRLAIGGHAGQVTAGRIG